MQSRVSQVTQSKWTNVNLAPISGGSATYAPLPSLPHSPHLLTAYERAIAIQDVKDFSPNSVICYRRIAGARLNPTKMLIRFTSSNLEAISIAYIVLAGASPSSLSTLQLDIPRKLHPQGMCEVSKKSITSILQGCMGMGLSMMFGFPKLLNVGFGICLFGSSIMLSCGLGQMFGILDWAEYRLKKEQAGDRDRLARLMEILKVDMKGKEEVVDMAKETVEKITLETGYGLLTTKRKDKREGFEISFEKGGKVVQADLVWMGNNGLDAKNQEWVYKVAEIVGGEPWDHLVSLYP
jgi:hypothetical protein